MKKKKIGSAIDGYLETLRKGTKKENKLKKSKTSKVKKLESQEVKKSKLSEVKKSRTSELKESKTSKVINFHTSKLPKYRTLIKLSILLRQDQLDSLENITREIMQHRKKGNKKERITKNTILRAYIDALKDLTVKTNNIPDEAELLKRIKEVIK